MRDIIISATVVLVVVSAWFIRILMDGRRLREKRALHIRRVENAEREALFSETHNGAGA